MHTLAGVIHQDAHLTLRPYDYAAAHRLAAERTARRIGHAAQRRADAAGAAPGFVAGVVSIGA